MERRTVRVVVPGHVPRSVLVDGSGHLPAYDLVLHGRETTVSAVTRAVLPRLGLPGPIIDFYIDQSCEPAPDMPVATFVELAAPAPSWNAPDGWRWVDVDDAPLEIEPELARRLADWIDERRGIIEADPARPDWTRVGWFERAQAWIARALDAAGLPAPVAVVQFRHWGISAVMQVEVEGGERFWFKAVSAHFLHEAAITALLDRVVPGRVAPVVACDRERGWLLLGDLATEAAPPDPGDHYGSFQHLVDIQRAVADRHPEIVAAGCRARPLEAVPEAVGGVLADPTLRAWLDVTPARAGRLVDWLVGAVAAVDRLELPDVLVHGDFHPGNVASVAGRRVLIDWSDAAIAKPFVDVVTWATWMEGDPAGVDALWDSFYDAWPDVMSRREWEAVRPVLEGIAGGYHVVSYAGIVRSLDLLRKPEHGGGLGDFLAVLDAAVPA